MSLSGNKLVGGNPTNERIAYDFYATNPKALEMLLNEHNFKGNKILEPCVGKGHLADVLKNNFPSSEITNLDIINRGYPNTIEHDFLKWETEEKFDTIITNPPYGIVNEFVTKGIDLLEDKGQMAFFLKIQFLEGGKRYKNIFKKYPPKYIYVFSNRMPTWANGEEINPKTKKKWVTTFCHAWFIWEKGSKTEPIIRWL